MTDLTRLGGAAFRTVMEKVGRGVSKVQERRPLSYDLLESEDAYLVVFDAPGVEREDVQVRFVDGDVEVRLDRYREFYEGSEMRFPGRGLALTGSANLPEDALVEPEGAEATLTGNGTLHVTVPKSDDATDVPVGDEADETVGAIGNAGDANGRSAGGENTPTGV